MPMTCVAYGCNNHFVKGCGKQFFRFPMKDPDRLSKWVMDIRRKNWKPSASSRICSDHFTESDYMLRPGAMVPRLRLDAVPSVFNGFPSYLKERLKKKKTSKKKINEQIIVMDDQHGTRDAVQNEVDKMKTCAVYGCNNTCYEGCQQRFFRFPTNDSEMLSKWLVAIHHGNCTSLTSNSICSDHFTENDYIVYPGATVPQLGPDAVPSLFPGLPTEIQAVVEPQNTQQADPTKNTVQSEIIKTKLHEISNKQSLSPQTQQVKHGPSERSRAVTCVVNDCSTIFVKGCGKRFFRSH
ncbi:uncharacterized protein LOC142647501 isoform X2 [Rhinoderma darwinii]|uniref:uncharacterized protein LOC142647501 isoform X2 n=1 Tax=Rhinoderma darwinii TaxID=43563 RepID=UPI003F6801AD